MELLSHLNVKSLELLESLNDEQRNIAAKVIAESLKQGVNPNFTLPLVKQESGFNHGAVSDKGAVGVMQLMPDTAAGLKVDPKDLDQNITGGIRLIKELSSNKMIGNDPIKVLAGYNASTETRNKFYESGDPSVLKFETLDYIDKIAKHAGDSLPSVRWEGDRTEAPAAQPETIFPQQVIPDRPAQLGELSPEGELILSGGAGYLAGTGVGAAKVGAIKTVKGVHDLIQSRRSGEPSVRIEPTMEPSSQQSVVRKPAAATTGAPSAGHGGENWVKALTGVDVPGGQMKKADLDLAKGMQAVVGRSGEPGFVGGQITPGGLIISPRTASEVQRQTELNQSAAQRQADINERLNQVLQRKASQPAPAPSLSENIVGLLKYGSPQQKEMAANAVARVKGAANVTNIGSAGMAAGMAAPAVISEFAKGEDGKPWQTIGQAAGLSALASMFPKAAPIVGGGLSALDVANRMRNEDYTGAALSAIGTVGPLAAASLLAPPIGVPLAVGSAMIPAAINAYRDYTNYVPPKKAGAGRGFVNPPLVQP